MAVPMHDEGMRYLRGSADEGIYTYVQYGNFKFPAALSLKFNVEPVYESSNRIPKWWKHTFTVETIIDPTILPQNDSAGLYPLDLNMSQIRRTLATPGLDLIFWNLGVGQNQRMDYAHASPTGLGDEAEPSSLADPIKQDPIAESESATPWSNHYSFFVNAKKDLNFGPKPELLVCEPVGSARVWRIVWTVSCCLPNCCIVYNGDTFSLCETPEHLNSEDYVQSTTDSFSSQFPKLTEFNYSMSWEIDTERFTNFTIVGSLEFAGTLLRENETDLSSFTATVINTRTVIEGLGKFFPLRKKFKRTMQYDLSRDKRRLDFRISDSEIKSLNPYYPGLDECQVSQSASGTPLGGKWRVTFNGAYRMQPRISKFYAFCAFISVIRIRLQELINSVSRLREQDNPKNYKSVLLPISFTIEEEIFDQTIRFSVAYDVFVSYANLMFACGFFRTFDWEQGWKDHQLSAETNPYNATHIGNSPIMTGENEELAGVCTGANLVAENGERKLKSVIAPEDEIQNDVSYRPLFTPTCPPKDSCLLDYQNNFSVMVQSKVVPQIPAGRITKEGSVDRFQFNQPNDKKLLDRTYGDVVINQNGVKEYGTTDGSGVKYASGILKSMAEEAGEPLERSTGIDTNKDAIPTSKNVTYQVNGPSEIRIVMEGYATSFCHPIIPPSLMTVKTRTKDGGTALDGNEGQGKTQRIDERPVLIESYVKGPIYLNSRSEMPILGYSWHNVYAVTGIPEGPIHLLFNNNTFEGSMSETLVQGTGYANADGLGLGTFEGENLWGQDPSKSYEQWDGLGKVPPVPPPKTLSS